MKKQLHSIVVPVYNSKEIVETLVSRIHNAMKDAQIHFELILVDDGSKDGVFEEIKRLSSIFTFIKGFRLSRNFGHQSALTIGLQKAKGSYIAIIDDDLQDPPEILPDFFDRLYNESDVVYGIRKKRKENIIKKTFYAGFYRILKIFSSIDIPVDAGDFCVMKRCVVDALLQLQLANHFLRGTRAWVGFKQIGIKYNRSGRVDGKSGYTFWKYLKLAATGIIMFSYIPLRATILIGLITTTITCLYVVGIVFYWLLKPFEVPGYLSLIVIVTFLGGTQLLCLGILGEYLLHINDNVRKWPVAFVAETTDVIK